MEKLKQFGQGVLRKASDIIDIKTKADLAMFSGATGLGIGGNLLAQSNYIDIISNGVDIKPITPFGLGLGVQDMFSMGQRIPDAIRAGDLSLIRGYYATSINVDEHNHVTIVPHQFIPLFSEQEVIGAEMVAGSVLLFGLFATRKALQGRRENKSILPA